MMKINDLGAAIPCPTIEDPIVTQGYADDLKEYITTTLTAINTFTPSTDQEADKLYLSGVWTLLKNCEKAFQEARHLTEKQIADVTPLVQGTTHISSGLKTSVSPTVKVDVTIVETLRAEFPAELLIFWPFEVKEMKVDKTKMEQLKAVNAELHKKAQDAITTVLGKPSFSAKEVK